jgi:hypothetical protein
VRQADAYWRRSGYQGPKPQTAPAEFSTAELVLEVDYLYGLDRRHGAHPLRAIAENNLLAVIARRPDRPRPKRRRR